MANVFNQQFKKFESDYESKFNFGITLGIISRFINNSYLEPLVNSKRELLLQTKDLGDEEKVFVNISSTLENMIGYQNGFFFVDKKILIEKYKDYQIAIHRYIKDEYCSKVECKYNRGFYFILEEAKLIVCSKKYI
jgi:hypothetical protein